MRFSKVAASLLSTVFTFRDKSLCVAGVFDSTNEAVDTVIFSANGVTANPTSRPTPATELNEKCNAGDNDCVHGRVRVPAASDVDTGILTHREKKAKGNKCKTGEEGCVHGRIRVPAVDTGILASPESAAKENVAPSNTITPAASICTTSFVDCVDGFVRGTAITCFDQCAGACCKYDSVLGAVDACEGFTGKVCMDTNSCIGERACEDANILSPAVMVMSCKGDYACFKAASKGGSIGSITDSCNADYACYYAAAYGGSIRSMSDSCNGYKACNYAAAYGGSTGSIIGSCNIYDFSCFYLGYRYGNVGDVVNSCDGINSCREIAAYGGTIGSITESCIGLYACYGLGERGGTVGNVNSACTDGFSCFYGGADRGVIGNIANSCSAFLSCDSLGRGKGKAGHVTDSCTGANSCQYAGHSRGSIGDIAQSCRSDDACTGAGSGLNGRITSNLMSCCNTGLECDYATQASLPATCNAAPTSAPTNSKVRERE